MNAAPLDNGSDACKRLQSVLHLVIGSDLEDGDLEWSRQHLLECVGCAELARQARRARQVYFEHSLREAAQPVDLWTRLESELRAEGLIRHREQQRTAPAGAEGQSPGAKAAAARSESGGGALAGAASTAGLPHSGLRPVRGPAQAADAGQLQGTKRPPGAAAEGGLSESSRLEGFKLAAVGLLGGGLIAAAGLFLLRPQPPADLPANASGALAEAVDPGGVAPNASEVSQPLAQLQPAAVQAEPAPTSRGGLRQIPPSQRLRAQGYDLMLYGLPTAPALGGESKESLVNWSYPR